MNPISPFLAWLRSRRLSRIAAEQERRREIIKCQIADRREHHREFRPSVWRIEAFHDGSACRGSGPRLARQVQP